MDAIGKINLINEMQGKQNRELKVLQIKIEEKVAAFDFAVFYNNSGLVSWFLLHFDLGTTA